MTDHPQPDVLRALARGEMEEEKHEATLLHLETCEPCFARMEALLDPSLALEVDRLWRSYDARRLESAVLRSVRRAESLNDSLQFLTMGVATVVSSFMSPLVGWLDDSTIDAGEMAS